jgi:hypothetical protein
MRFLFVHVACSFGRWLVAGAGLFREKKYRWLIADGWVCSEIKVLLAGD